MSKGPWRRNNEHAFGLADYERHILDLWDAGKSIEMLIDELPYAERTIRVTISMFGGGGADDRAFRDRAREGSLRLAAAIAATGKAFA